MEKVFFGLGSNLGDRARYLQQAREALADLPLQEFQASSVYESLPLANMDQPLYLNQVVCGQTTLGPESLLETCLQIEKRLGRIRWEHWGPRIIQAVRFARGTSRPGQNRTALKRRGAGCLARTAHARLARRRQILGWSIR